MKFEIRKANNGWIVKCNGEETVCASDGATEHEALIALMYEIQYEFGSCASKYEERNIYTSCMPGNSFDGDIDEEYFTEMLGVFSDLLEALSKAIKHRRKNKLKQFEVEDYHNDAYSALERYSRKRIK